MSWTACGSLLHVAGLSEDMFEDGESAGSLGRTHESGL